MSTADITGYIVAEAGYAETREQLILDHLPQVKWIATRIYEKLASTVPLEDLISTGIVGLINAIDAFDPSYNVKLKTYAEHKIRGAILDSVRGMDGIPDRKRKQLKEVQAAILSLENRLQRSATEEEISAELNMTLAEYQEALLQLRAVTLDSLDEVSDGFSESRLMNVIASNDAHPGELLEREELQRVLADGIQKMPHLERTILSLYYLEGQSLRDVAEILDVHMSRASQLKTQAILRLRTYMIKKWPNSKGTM